MVALLVGCKNEAGIGVVGFPFMRKCRFAVSGHSADIRCVIQTCFITMAIRAS